MSVPVVLFRADASPEIGTGHLMRCLALAQAVREAGGRAAFACAEVSPSLRERLERDGYGITPLLSPADADEVAAIGKKLDAAWIVVDGYRFDTAYQAGLRQRGFRILFIDDDGRAGRYDADLVLNQNPYASEEMYANRDQTTVLLLGTRYALLRTEFRPWQSWKRETRENARRILVTLGGGDSGNAIGTMLKVLRQVTAPIEVEVVIGGSNPHAEEIRATAAGTPFRTEVVVDATDMPDRMAQADLAICAGGTTVYELCLLQLPMLMLVMADNQEPVAQSLAEAGAGVNLGRAVTLDPSALAQQVTTLLGDAALRRSIAERGRQLVDGVGTDRVAMRLLGSRIRLRPAGTGDARLLFDWANDPQARAASLSPAPISWETHVTWLAKKLADPLTMIFIGADADDTPVGTVRFEEKNGEDVLSIAVSSAQRGKGLGKELLRMGATRFFARKPGAPLHAYVKPENAPSAALFRGMGFAELSEAEIQGQRALHFVLERATMAA